MAITSRVFKFEFFCALMETKCLLNKKVMILPVHTWIQLLASLRCLWSVD